jgi:S1-C subfamily serine protease
VPHQLRDLGIKNIGTLLPMDVATACNELQAGLADAVFALPRRAREKAPPPRLGVRLEPSEQGVRIASITAGSLAETSGLQTGDHILTVAGAPASMTNLIAAVRNQPAGTWLPVQVRRAENTLDLVIKFPGRT